MRQYHLFSRRFLSPLIRAFLAVFIVISPVNASEEKENAIKTVMMRKFVDFITWPEQYSPKTHTQFNACVLGDSRIVYSAAIFEKQASASSIAFKMFRVDSVQNLAGRCHLVFVTAGKEGSLAELSFQPVLTISDMPRFVERGGMIGFEIIDGKIRYNINNKSFSKAGLKVDAQLLEIANKVVDLVSGISITSLFVNA